MKAYKLLSRLRYLELQAGQSGRIQWKGSLLQHQQVQERDLMKEEFFKMGKLN